MKKRTRLIAGVMAMMLTLGGCGSAANTANKKETTQTTAEQTAYSQEDTAEAAAKETELDVLKIGLAALPTQLDPDRSIGIASIKLFYNIFDTLLFTDKEGNITGQLADSWEWQDDTTLNVKIRENVTFQNGEVCDAEDVKFTFDRILSGYGDGTIAVLYETLDSVEKIDDLTVQFKLKKPDAAFEQRLGSIWGASIVPKDYIEEIGDEAFQLSLIHI